MGKKLEKTYRSMMNEGKEEALDENATKVMVPAADDDMEVDAEKQSTQKKGDEPEKPSTAANRMADDKSKGLAKETMANAEGKKTGLQLKEGKVKEEDDCEDDDKEEMDEQSAKETPAERERRGVPAKKSPLEEGKKMKKEEEGEDMKKGEEDDEELDEKAAAANRRADKMDEELETLESTLEADLSEATSKAVEDMGSLLEGQEDLQEEHKDQVKTLFEAALADKTKVIRANLEEQYELKLDEAVKTVEDELIESLDIYLGKVVEEWLEENRLAVESGVKAEITESFLASMKTVFEDHYVDVPEEKMDIVENIIDENEQMETQLNESMKREMALKAELAAFRKKEIISELSEGLTMTEQERLADLCEDIDYADKDSFAKKATVIKENFLKKASSGVEQEILNEDAAIEASKPAGNSPTDVYSRVLSSMSVNKFDTKTK